MKYIRQLLFIHLSFQQSITWKTSFWYDNSCQAHKIKRRFFVVTQNYQLSSLLDKNNMKHEFVLMYLSVAYQNEFLHVVAQIRKGRTTWCMQVPGMKFQHNWCKIASAYGLGQPLSGRVDSTGLDERSDLTLYNEISFGLLKRRSWYWKGEGTK